MVRPASPTTLDVDGHIVRLFPLELIIGQFEVLVVLLVVDSVSIERRMGGMSVWSVGRCIECAKTEMAYPRDELMGDIFDWDFTTRWVAIK